MNKSKDVWPYIRNTYKVFVNTRKEADKICEVANTGLAGVHRDSSGAAFGYDVIINEKYVGDIEEILKEEK